MCARWLSPGSWGHVLEACCVQLAFTCPHPFPHPSSRCCPPTSPVPCPADFYEYFHAAGELLDLDDSLFAVSAWNDNGYRQMVTSKCVGWLPPGVPLPAPAPDFVAPSPRPPPPHTPCVFFRCAVVMRVPGRLPCGRYALRRTSFFPGLGWLLTRKLAMTLFPQVPAAAPVLTAPPTWRCAVAPLPC